MAYHPTKLLPEHANVTILLLSLGGAHLLNRTCAEGNVTPYILCIIMK